ncbi:thiamine pyrophosphate-dependent dehydrogenase E1 component subunit alpha [Micromonospora echinofusca]|uniref:Pyruvate dehydrogenase (Acetyl-transferring) E1 component subunit alpha n=1 Tax=Micromonospora echinofusca TaxID=47858 RepID=A0ABS3VV59_MICEH|nr:thiamine pyrophosphate-dependent dehydrogenase E1 component subunit alpha [Micromonospora echinofusca]MBO4208424.1 pyruvate dehydrogenase (acetyl-transferring) E1 component subunit alpha [Micromonospora echinofusca]
MTSTPSSHERRAALGDPVQAYRRMQEIRSFEDRITGLFAQGLVHGTTHTCQGQEALDVGLANALRLDDIVTCTYRGHGIALALGMSPEAVLGEIMGRTSGCIGGVGGSMHLSDLDVGLLPTFAIVGAGLPVAAGAALAFQNRGEDRVAVAVCGDGATNIGAFHEAINMAAVWKLPVVFVVDNNLYGEYSRINLTTPVTDLSRRADAYGIPGESVDGMDLDTVGEALSRHVAAARSGAGPSLLEVRTYRFAGHSRADQATYRPAGELDVWRQRDPLVLRRAALIDAGIASAAELDAVEQSVRAMITDVVEATSAVPEPDARAMFANIMPPLATSTGGVR